MKRMVDDCMAKKIMNSFVGEDRCKGRPKWCWTDGVRSALRGSGMSGGAG